MSARRRRPRGFSLVEVTVVIAALGIISAVAAPRLFDDRSFHERGYSDELAAALAQAQKLAATSGCAVRFEIGARGYVARQLAAPKRGGCDPAVASAADAAGDNPVLSGSSPFGVTTTPSVKLTFDGFGRNDLAADQTVMVGAFALTVRAGNARVAAP